MLAAAMAGSVRGQNTKDSTEAVTLPTVNRHDVINSAVLKS
jgi:hypothetical protein